MSLAVNDIANDLSLFNLKGGAAAIVEVVAPDLALIGPTGACRIVKEDFATRAPVTLTQITPCQPRRKRMTCWGCARGQRR